MELDELMPYLIQQSEQWLYQQRRAHLIKARALSSEERPRLKGYFEERILDLTRVVRVDRISNPELYDELREKGLTVPMDFTSAVGVALIDCVLMRERSESISTLFHEMVHIVQFDLLGVTRFLELYLLELFQNKSQYYDIVFEKQAYTLSHRFALGEQFSVRDILECELSQFTR